MRSRIIVLSSLILLLTVLVCGQDNATTLYSDDVGRTSCEELKARIDAVFIVLAANPGSVGVVELAEQGDALKSLGLESIVTGTMIARNYDAGRLWIFRTAASDRIVMRLRVIPDGSDPSSIKTKVWDLTLNLQRTLELYEEYDEVDSVCPGGSLTGHFFELLAANQRYRGNIVIREKNRSSWKNRRKVIEESNIAVPLSRLRFFYVRSKYPVIEYWLVPPKKRK